MTNTLEQLEKNINLLSGLAKSAKNKILVVFLDTTLITLFPSLAQSFYPSIMFKLIFLSSLSVPYQGIVIQSLHSKLRKQRRFITTQSWIKDTIGHYFCHGATGTMTERTPSQWMTRWHLTTLINSLVALPRLEEQPDIVLQDVDFSYITEDAEDFLSDLSFEMVNLLSWHHTGYSCKGRRSLLNLWPPCG